MRSRLSDVGQGWLLLAVITLVLLFRAPDLDWYLVNADHGYQLSLGGQILLGRFPFVDLIFHYGPLVAFTSALALWTSHGLVAETVICALGYATSLLLVHRMSRTWVSPAAGWIAPLLGLLLLARFYKWYLWLFPMAALYCYQRSLRAKDRSFGWILAAGLASGFLALYRLDFGAAVVLALAMLLMAESYGAPDRLRTVRSLGALTAGFGVPFGLWLVTLALVGGGSAVRDYSAATLAGGRGVATHWALGFPSFAWNFPFAPRSGLLLALLALPTTYLFCAVVGFWNGYIQRGENRSEARFMAAVGLLGLATFPQAAHRADIQHLLQVLPPMLIAAPLAIKWLWRSSRRGQIGGDLWQRAVVVAYIAILLLSCVGIHRRAGRDLAPFGSDLVTRYQELHMGIEAGGPHPVALIVDQITRAAAPDEYILVVPLACQVYYFANRPMSGLLNGYAPGIFDDEEWRRRNLEHVRLHPPSAVIAEAGFLVASPEDPFRQSHPELYLLLATRYRRIVYDSGGWIILAPDEPLATNIGMSGVHEGEPIFTSRFRGQRLGY